MLRRSRFALGRKTSPRMKASIRCFNCCCFSIMQGFGNCSKSLLLTIGSVLTPCCSSLVSRCKFSTCSALQASELGIFGSCIDAGLDDGLGQSCATSTIATISSATATIESTAVDLFFTPLSTLNINSRPRDISNHFGSPPDFYLTWPLKRATLLHSLPISSNPTNRECRR
jgi:hypothetical protein